MIRPRKHFPYAAGHSGIILSREVAVMTEHMGDITLHSNVWTETVAKHMLLPYQRIYTKKIGAHTPGTIRPRGVSCYVSN